MRLTLLAAGLSAALFSCSASREIKDISYDDRFGERTTLDVYMPDGDGPRPVVMLIHGGSWRFGSPRRTGMSWNT